MNKKSVKISRVSADTDTRKKREYRPIISADRYIGRSLVLMMYLTLNNSVFFCLAAGGPCWCVRHGDYRHTGEMWP